MEVAQEAAECRDASTRDVQVPSLGVAETVELGLLLEVFCDVVVRGQPAAASFSRRFASWLKERRLLQPFWFSNTDRFQL
jgi:hypothetical protein